MPKKRQKDMKPRKLAASLQTSPSHYQEQAQGEQKHDLKVYQEPMDQTKLQDVRTMATKPFWL